MHYHKPHCARAQNIQSNDTNKLTKRIICVLQDFNLHKHLEPRLLNICTPPTFDWLAGRTQPESGMPAKQVIQDLHLHIQGVGYFLVVGLYFHINPVKK